MKKLSLEKFKSLTKEQKRQRKEKWLAKKAKQNEKRSYKGELHEKEVILDGKKRIKIIWDEDPIPEKEECKYEEPSLQKLLINYNEKLDKKDILLLKYFAKENKFYFNLPLNLFFINGKKYHLGKRKNTLYGISDDSKIININSLIYVMNQYNKLTHKWEKMAKKYKS